MRGIMSKKQLQSKIDFTKITDGLNKFNAECQSIIDSIGELIVKREAIRNQPAPVEEIERRLMITVDHEIKKYKKNHSFSDYIQGPERSNYVDNNLFTHRVKSGDSGIDVFDAGAFMLFNYDVVKKRVSEIAQEIVLPDAGLSPNERELMIAKLDEEIIELELKKDKLYEEARASGFNVTESFQ